MLANFDQFFTGVTDAANIRAVATSLATLLGQLKNVDCPDRPGAVKRP
jgi:hypothetical protein